MQTHKKNCFAKKKVREIMAMHQCVTDPLMLLVVSAGLTLQAE